MFSHNYTMKKSKVVKASLKEFLPSIPKPHHPEKYMFPNRCFVKANKLCVPHYSVVSYLVIFFIMIKVEMLCLIIAPWPSTRPDQSGNAADGFVSSIYNIEQIFHSRISTITFTYIFIISTADIELTLYNGSNFLVLTDYPRKFDNCLSNQRT